jgi:hypothetical protein
MSTVVDFSRLQQAGSLPVEELLRQLKTQGEQELNEARAIQPGLMPRSTLETADVTVCYDFQPFHDVGGDFLDFFQLSDQTIGIYLGDVTGGCRVVCSAGGNTTGSAQDRHGSGRSAEPAESQDVAAQHFAPLSGGGVCVF